MKGHRALGDALPGTPYIQPGPWESKLIDQDMIGVWLDFGVGAPKQCFIIRNVGAKAAGFTLRFVRSAQPARR